MFRMGVVADTFWRLPGVLRSDSPHAFCRQGAVCSQHNCPHNQLTFLTASTARLAGYPSWTARYFYWVLVTPQIQPSTWQNICPVCGTGARNIFRILKDGLPARLDYAEIDHCRQNFNLVDGWLDEEGLQRKGRVGNADARLARSRGYFACRNTPNQAKRDCFLTSSGFDEQCDEARAYMSFPILEFDPTAEAFLILSHPRLSGPRDVPEHCVICFKEVIEKVVDQHHEDAEETPGKMVHTRSTRSNIREGD